MTTSSGGARDWRDPTLSASEIADLFVRVHGDALRETGAVLSVPGAQDLVAAGFIDRAVAALERVGEESDGVRCLAVFSPPVVREDDEDPYFYSQTVREAEQEIAVRLSDDMFPLVISFFDVYGSSPTPSVYAVGESGVSDTLPGNRVGPGGGSGWPEDFGDDFRVNPEPAVDLASRWGADWLGRGARPNPQDYEASGFENGDITKYLETHEPGGADAIVAASVLGFGGIGVYWYLSRRTRLIEQEAQRGAEMAPTRVPLSIVERLPELLEAPTPAVDPQRATSSAGLDWALALRDAGDDCAILAERIRARLPDGSVKTRTVTSRMVDDAVPPVEAAALVVLRAEVESRERMWERHLQDGLEPDPARLPRFCAFNPFHGQTTLTASVQGASASVDVPACTACRDALGRDEAPDALRVLSDGRVRGYTDVHDDYATSMFGAVRPLGPIVTGLPDSQPVGRRDGRGDVVRGCLSLLVMPVLILLLAAIIGASVSILLAGWEPERFFTEAELAQRAAEAGPTVLGYPILNALRGAGIGAVGALLFAGLAAAIVTAFRSSGDGSGTGSDADGTGSAGSSGFDPNRPSELKNPAVQQNILRLRDGTQ